MNNQFLLNGFKFIFLFLTTSYHWLSTFWEKSQQVTPGNLIDLGGYKVHYYQKGEGDITVVFDHSLGGIEGYFLINKIAEITKVFIYDRPGYGCSDSSPKQRCSEEIVYELDQILQKAEVSPPYLLVGDSFGSYNVRLYAHYFPERVCGIVLTDGLHEKGMLNLPLSVKLLKTFFLSGFIISIVGATLGLIRLLGDLKVFELIKPQLKKFDRDSLILVKQSFYHPKHWLTMAREIWNLETSATQVKKANNLGNIPLISIKAKTFFNPSIFTFFLPLKAINKIRNIIHDELLKLSSNSSQILANKSSHFVWIDEPEIIISAIKQILNLDLL
ncbi:alpha/beta hydrolase [Crocosphaera sp.]|uniref:alpha/beta fold hydrolase n=1 Tax=Crocosphaera sp. TaxID=2729996 RepID=UPI00262AA979|nr:alpha/beta hydrolase [Crocosphaera sp.]MDJ0581641.1 alpha/beta hydrolase [Crocosphaera sp.]